MAYAPGRQHLETRKAFVLCSGGLDSTTCLMKAIYDFGTPDSPEDIDKRIDLNRAAASRSEGSEPIDNDPISWVEAISIYYGQRHKKEMQYAKATCESLGIKHTILDVGNLLRGDTVMLTDDSRGKVEVPDISYSDIQGVSPTYVPFRNGLLLSAITAHAQKWVNQENQRLSEQGVIPQDLVSAGIYFGAHAEDAANWAYPDCTPEFIGAMSNAIYIGSYRQIRLYTPIQWLMKADIITLGESYRTDYASTWSCYKGEALHCGICPTCRSRREGFFAAGVEDPTDYAH